MRFPLAAFFARFRKEAYACPQCHEPEGFFFRPQLIQKAQDLVCRNCKMPLTFIVSKKSSGELTLETKYNQDKLRLWHKANLKQIKQLHSAH